MREKWSLRERDWRRGLLPGVICGAVVSGLWMYWLYFLSTLPAISPASLSLALRPWWKLDNWLSTAFVFVVASVVFWGIARGLRFRRRKNAEQVDSAASDATDEQ